jgi:hypothetical protein
LPPQLGGVFCSPFQFELTAAVVNADGKQFLAPPQAYVFNVFGWLAEAARG